MSETPEAQAPTEATEGSAPAQDATDWKSEARKWEARAKENKEAADALAALEEAKKTEEQKLQERLIAAEKLASQSAAEALRFKVLANAGIPEEYQDLVVGSTEEDLTAAASKVKALVAANQPAPQQARFTIPSEGTSPALALNDDGIEQALRDVLGIQ